MRVARLRGDSEEAPRAALVPRDAARAPVEQVARRHEGVDVAGLGAEHLRLDRRVVVAALAVVEGAVVEALVAEAVELDVGLGLPTALPAPLHAPPRYEPGAPSPTAPGPDAYAAYRKPDYAYAHVASPYHRPPPHHVAPPPHHVARPPLPPHHVAQYLSLIHI